MRRLIRPTRRALCAGSAALLLAGWRKGGLVPIIFSQSPALASPSVAGTVWNETLAAITDGSRVYQAGTMDFAATIDPTGGNAFNQSRFTPYVAAYLADTLTLDTTWGVGGITFIENFTTNLGLPVVRDWEGVSLALDPVSGLLYMAATWYDLTTWKATLCRFNRDGTLDNSFANATGGVFFVAPAGAARAQFVKVRCQSNGGIILASNFPISGNFAMYITRLKQDGTVDTSFGATGSGFTQFFNTVQLNEQYGFGLAVQGDNKILVGSGIGSPEVTFWIARIDGATGNSDASFGTSGVQTVSFPQHLGASIQDMVVTPQNKILCGGMANYNSSNFGLSLAQLNIDGSLDSTFGSSGIMQAPTGIQANDQVAPNGLFIEGQRIVVFGFSYSTASQFYSPTRQGYSVKFTLAGAVDTTWGTSGLLTIPFLNSDANNNEELYTAIRRNQGEYFWGGHLYATSGPGTQAYIGKMVAGSIQTTYSAAPTAPTATTSATSSIATTTATMNGTVNPNGVATSYCFQYSRASGLYTNKTAVQSAGSGVSGVGVTANLTGLISGMTYFGRLAAWNGTLQLGAEVTWTQL
jgi:uncharacterized delta-60 repeat protein